MKTSGPGIGLTLGSYGIREHIARSRWTSVYSAVLEGSPDLFAIKVFDLNGSLEPGIGTEDEVVWRNRFDLEIRILDSLDHPGIISLHDRGHLDDGRPYFVMPFIAANLAYEIGGDVSDPEVLARLAPPRRPKPLPIKRVVSLLYQITDALVALHGKGIIHRDMKPGNVLLTQRSGGQVKLCDFGMARWGDQVFDVSGEFIGSKEYVSPEQRLDPATSDARTDVYSVGVMAYRLLAGKLPNNGGVSVCRVNDSVPAALDQLIAACMDPEPANRPDDAMALKAALDKMPSSLVPAT